jgi:anaerobic selenocysteine-containing dehydrogenase
MDPRGHSLVRFAAETLRFTPGRDVAMLNALLHTIIEEGLTDRQYIQAHTEDYEKLREHIKDYDALASCYAREAVVWHSHDSLYQPRADNLAMLKRGMTSLPKVRFKDRRIRVFEGGFVQQHTIFVTREDGFVGQMDVCFVGYVRDGMISRAYEYFDTGQIEKFAGPPATASG